MCIHNNMTNNVKKSLITYHIFLKFRPLASMLGLKPVLAGARSNIKGNFSGIST